MNVLFLVPRLDKASTRYRVLQFLPILEEKGVGYQVISLSGTSRKRYLLYKQIRDADIVFVQKKLFTPLEFFWIRLLADCLVYDFDDSVMFKSGPVNALQGARQMRRFARTVSRSDLVLAGNKYLKEQAQTYNKKTRVLPTALDMARYTERPLGVKTTQGVTLGWIGSKGTLRYLKEITPALEDLGQRWPGLKLKIVADDFFDLENVQVIKKPWATADEISDLHSFDIGLMPLSDDVWTRGKCGFKLLQCMAVGLPVVCSPVGVNTEIVTDGREGFQATTMEEWVDKLDILIAGTELRRQMGILARQKVEQAYSLAATGRLLIEYLRNCLA